jgi:hypothetical protein
VSRALSEREAAALRRSGFDAADVAEIAEAVDGGEVFIAIERDGTARVHFRDGDVLEPVEDDSEEGAS